MGQGFGFDRSRVVLLAGEVLLLLGVLLVASHVSGELPSTDSRGLVAARLLLVVLSLQICFAYAELYDPRALRSRVHFFLQVVRSFAASALILFFIYYLLPVLRLQPATLLGALPLGLLVVFAWHGVHRWAGGQEAMVDHVLIVGTGPTAELIADEIERREAHGYRVMAFLAEHPDEVGWTLRGVSVPGTCDELIPLVTSLRIDLIVVAIENRRGRLPVDDLLRCRVEGVDVEDAPGFYERLTGKILLSDLRPSWLVFSPGFRRPRLVTAAKRLMELPTAIAMLTLTAPLLGLLALIIRLDSPGPALLRQTRVGFRGRPFEIYKLRTMRADAEAESGPVWTDDRQDRRVTRPGRVLRRLRLDELPQILNVIRGEMSFVGPRPERPHFVEQLRQVIPHYEERHGVRPGITGWAQVKFGYGSTLEDTECKLQFDLYYVKNMTPLLDLAILLDTVKVIVVGRGAR